MANEDKKDFNAMLHNNKDAVLDRAWIEATGNGNTSEAESRTTY